MIIDCHGHYTTAPKPLQDFRDAQTARLKDPALPAPGPIAVSDRIAPYLPVPLVVRAPDGTFALEHDRDKTIGRLRGFHGNYGTFVRAYAYICSLGADGLRDASETAVLNANYLLARLRELAAGGRTRVHVADAVG